jgi:SgrR family transcriptional regulator
MKLMKHYLKLRSQLAAVPDDQVIPIKIQDLTNYLDCTARHVKLLLKQMNALGWIEWRAARGRGKHSQLIFLKNTDEIREKLTKDLINKGKYTEIINIINEVDPDHQEHFKKWLDKQFGHVVQKENNQEIDILRYPYYPAITTLDPTFIQTRHEFHLVDHIFDTLFKFNPKTQKIDSHLIHYWESQEQGRTWIFHLKKGVKFHHGREMTAEDVKLTVERLMLEETHFKDQWMFNNIQHINVLKNRVIRIELKEPNYLFPHCFYNPQTSIIPIDIYKKDPRAFAQMPIGSGPFKITKHDDSIISLQAFDSYFKERPQLDRIEIVNFPYFNTETSDHIINFISSDDKSHDPSWRKIIVPEDGAAFISFNMSKKGPQQQLKFREAIYHAIDKEKMCREIRNGRFLPADSLYTSRTNQDYSNSYNLKKAKKLIEEVGYNQEPLKLYTTKFRHNFDYQPESLWIKEQCEQVGIKIVVEVFPVEELLRPEVFQEADLVITGAVIARTQSVLYKYYQSPTSFIKQFAGKSMSQTFHQYLSIIQEEPNETKQMELLLQLEDLLKQEYAVIFLYHRNYVLNVNEKSQIQGVSLNWFGRINYKNIWFKPRL